MKLYTQARKYGAQIAVGGAALVGAAQSFAADPATALEAIQGLSTSSTGFGPVLWGLAAATVGILIGVKWIKRGKNAA